MSEARAILKELEGGRRLVIVRVNSGYGVSRFLVPALTKALNERHISYIFTDLPDLDLADLKNIEAEKVLIVDELGGSADMASNIAILHDLMRANSELQVVILYDTENQLNQGRLFSELTSESSTVEVKPKLLSPEQALEYVVQGPPERRYSPSVQLRGSFLEGLSTQQVSQIIASLQKRYPLHFRVVDALRDIDAHGEDGVLMSFEDRLKLIESTSRIPQLQRAMGYTGLEKVTT
jgi:hypothetical protein